MLRLNKPVRLLEWGEGTNTLNQVWSVCGEGRIVKEHTKDGLTTLTVELTGQFQKKNQADPSVKITQQGERMTARSEQWGEVAMGNVKSSDGRTVQIEIPYALNIDKRR